MMNGRGSTKRGDRRPVRMSAGALNSIARGRCPDDMGLGRVRFMLPTRSSPGGRSISPLAFAPPGERHFFFCRRGDRVGISLLSKLAGNPEQDEANRLPSLFVISPLLHAQKHERGRVHEVVKVSQE